ncbi:MAG TPA: helix-turn-helix transcriptional regulator [Solirubrobacter sp.]|jgi:DNA-binding CsgD family transcriptional regulator|nr:helix-turn-helix transcriptional regulator [Solirubrobacter sp.]
MTVREDLVRLAHSGVGVREYALRATRILSRSVDFDGVAVLTTDPATGLETGAFVQNGLPDDATPRLVDIEHREGDVNTFAALARSGRYAASLSHETGGELERSVRHRELRAPAGLGDELRTALVSDSATWGGLTLGRATDRRPFSTDDVALMASLSPYLAEGIKRAALLTALSAGQAERGAGVALLAPDNSIASADACAEAWLAELGRGVPAVVGAVASRARRVADGCDDGVAQARLQTQAGVWITVRGSVLASGQTAVTIEPAAPQELAPVIADAYALTRRERAVVELVAQGLPTGAIASVLHVTAWTVQDHLKSAFEKVGTNSRGELIARLFFAHRAPRLSES